MKIVNLVASAALVAGALVPVSFAPSMAAQAKSPSEENCDGVFWREGGQVYCISEEHVGNSDNSQTVTDTEESNGTLNNKPKHAEECDGTGSSPDGSDHCRPR